MAKFDLKLCIKGGLKRMETENLHELKSFLYNKIYKQEINDNICRDLISGLFSQVLNEISRRKRTKRVWIKFTCVWSGYGSSSAPCQELGCEYIKLDRKIAEKLPSSWKYKFSDKTCNYWTIKIAQIKPKHYKSSGYSNQVNEFIKEQKEVQNGKD